MAPSKWSKAIGAMKDQTSIGLAKTGSNYLSDLKVAIVKATRHEEYPPDERYAREIINLTTYKRAYVNSCVMIIAKRLYKTKNWVVALKSLMLVHRFLNEGNLEFDQEIYFASRRGTRLLNMSDFKDKTGRSKAWDYSTFVRTYAAYLDERLEYRIERQREKKNETEEDEKEWANGGHMSNALVLRDTPVGELKNEIIFSRAHRLMKLLEKFLACTPTGVARHNRVVAVALHSIVKDSFKLCNEITEMTGVLIDRFMDLEIPDMVKVHEVFSRVSKLYDELDVFYSWCQTIGVAHSSEYPEVEKILQKKLDTMYEYIHEKAGMLQKKKKTTSDPEPDEETKEKKDEPGEDVKEIKALPPPEGFVEETATKDEETKKTQEVGDLLDLSEDTPSIEDHGDKLALALFDGIPATYTQTSTVSPWEAFKDSTGDWETALIQSASQLTNQNASLPKGFDPLMLDGMYKQGISSGYAAPSGYVANGSVGSVAYGVASGQPVLALPVVPGVTASLSRNYDPFAASVGLAPPTYVQMSDMEKRQSSYVQEQMMWQQYAQQGMQGNAQFASLRYQSPYQYNTGGFTKTSFY